MKLTKNLIKSLHKDCDCDECFKFGCAIFSLEQLLRFKNWEIEDFNSFKKVKPSRKDVSFWYSFFGLDDSSIEDNKRRRIEIDLRMKDIRENSSKVAAVIKRMDQKLNDEPITDWNYCKCWLCISEFATQKMVKEYKDCFTGCEECESPMIKYWINKFEE